MIKVAGVFAPLLMAPADVEGNALSVGGNGGGGGYIGIGATAPLCAALADVDDVTAVCQVVFFPYVDRLHALCVSSLLAHHTIH
jgi:hypothetical protein